MKLLTLITFLLLSFSTTAKGPFSVTGAYECEGNLEKLEFKLEVKKDGSFEKVTRAYLKEGVVRTDSDKGKPYYSNLKIVPVLNGSRERVSKKGAITSAFKKYVNKVKFKDGQNISKLNKGAKYSGIIERVVEDKMTNEKKSVTYDFSVEVIGQEAMRHPVLGNITVWNLKQTVTTKIEEGTTIWNINTKYSQDYGFLEYEEKDSLGDQVYYSEKCKLVNWKKA